MCSTSSCCDEVYNKLVSLKLLKFVTFYASKAAKFRVALKIFMRHSSASALPFRCNKPIGSNNPFLKPKSKSVSKIFISTDNIKSKNFPKIYKLDWFLGYAQRKKEKMKLMGFSKIHPLISFEIRYAAKTLEFLGDSVNECVLIETEETKRFIYRRGEGDYHIYAKQNFFGKWWDQIDDFAHSEKFGEFFLWNFSIFRSKLRWLSFYWVWQNHMKG